MTDCLKPGDNELVICVRDAIGTVTESYVDQYSRKPDCDPDNNADFYCTSRNYVNLGSVLLRTAPAVRVRQALVLPKVDQGKIRVLARVENASKQAGDFLLAIKVQQFGKDLPADFPAKKVHLDAGQMKEVELIGEVQDLAEYTPASPALRAWKYWFSSAAHPNRSSALDR